MDLKKRYIWLPLLLFVYFAFMTWWFGREILAAGQYGRFFITIGAEILILIILSYMLRLKYKMAQKREEEDKIKRG